MNRIVRYIILIPVFFGIGICSAQDKKESPVPGDQKVSPGLQVDRKLKPADRDQAMNGNTDNPSKPGPIAPDSKPGVVQPAGEAAPAKANPLPEDPKKEGNNDTRLADEPMVIQPATREANGQFLPGNQVRPEGSKPGEGKAIIPHKGSGIQPAGKNPDNGSTSKPAGKNPDNGSGIHPAGKNPAEGSNSQPEGRTAGKSTPVQHLSGCGDQPEAIKPLK